MGERGSAGTATTSGEPAVGHRWGLGRARRRMGRLRGALADRYERVPEPVRRFVDWLRSPEFVTTSSSLAFYAMISLPPMVLLGLWVAGWFVDESTLQGLGTQVEDQAPDQLPVADVLRGLIDVAARIGPVAAVAAIWPATTYGAALARAFTDVAPRSEQQMQGWKGRALALVIVAVLPVVVFSALASIYFVPRLLGSGPALQVALWMGSLLVLGMVIALIYVLFRLRDNRWSDVAVGAGTAAALVALTTAGYLVYLEFADLGSRYGVSALATAVLLGLWLLLGNAALITGYRVMSRRSRRWAAGEGATRARGRSSSPRRRPP